MGSSQSKRSRQMVISHDEASKFEQAISKQQRRSLLKQVKQHQQQQHIHEAAKFQGASGNFFPGLSAGGGKLAHHHHLPHHPHQLKSNGGAFIDRDSYSTFGGQQHEEQQDYMAAMYTGSSYLADCASCATTNFACDCITDDVSPFEYSGRYANANITKQHILNGASNAFLNHQHNHHHQQQQQRQQQQQHIGVASRRRPRRFAQGNKLLQASSMISLSTTTAPPPPPPNAIGTDARRALATTSELGVEADEDALGAGACSVGAAALGGYDIANNMQLLAPPPSQLLAAQRGLKGRGRASAAARNRLHYYNNYSPNGDGSQSSTSQYSSHFSSSLAANASQLAHNSHNIAHLQQANQNLVPTSNHLHQQMFLQPRHQRGLAYSEHERTKLGLKGLLPAAHQSQELQVQAVMNFIEHCGDELSKYVYLRHLKDFNELLFYAALTKNVEKLMPLVYTPTVGLACQKFSEIYLRPRGLFITINDIGQVGSILANWPEKDVRVIVVTDGERILGLGDLGANGMGISIGKLSLYTALAGIPPQHVLPITIDVGTNNQSLLDDPFYIGLRQSRTRGQLYDELLEEFMQSVVERWGRSCLIQFEDFANATAFTLLQKYREKYCTFNDDIQGTASVCLAGLISAAKLVGRRLADCSFLFYGAGEANLGTANLLIMAMMEEGSSKQEATSKIWLVDSKGLVVESRDDLSSHKRHYAQVGAPQLKDLESIIAHTKPAAIIGASAQGGAFSEAVCKKMAQFNEKPIIFALSNPTSKAECTAEQAYQWTEGRCVFASGSPFEPVHFKGKTYITGQGNNAYIFPGVGLAAIAAHIHTIPEETFLVSAKALSDQLTETDTSVGLVYPRLNRIREVTLRVAERVLEHFYAERLATYRPEPQDKCNFLKSIQFDCRYESNDLRRSSLSQLLSGEPATGSNKQ